MLVTQLLGYIRDDVLRDFESPPLFSDAALLSALNSGVALMARRTHIFVDQVQLETEPDVAHYTIAKNILFIRSITNDRGIHLFQLTRKYKLPHREGVPVAFYTDTTFRSKIELVPTPTDIYFYDISFVYKPELLIGADDLPLEHDHAMLLADYVASKLLRTNDPDGTQMVAARNFEESWNQGIQEMAREHIRYSAGDNPTAQPRLWT